MKAFENLNGSSAALVSSYSVLKLVADCTVMSSFNGIIKLYTGEDKKAILIIMFNILAVSLGFLFGVLADRTEIKHTGVRLGALLIALGFIWPYSWGVTIKVVLMAIGYSALTVYCGGTIFRFRMVSNYVGLGFFCAAGIIGMAIGRFAAIIGYVSVSLVMIIAAVNAKITETVAYKEYRSNLRRLPVDYALSAVMAVLAVAILVILSATVGKLEYTWLVGRKMLLLAAVIAAVGMIVGDILYRYIGIIPCLVIGLGGGLFIYNGYGSSKIGGLAAIALFNIVIPAILNVVCRNFGKHCALGFGICGIAVYGTLVAGYLYPDVIKGDLKSAIIASAVSAAAGIVIFVLQIIVRKAVRREENA